MIVNGRWWQFARPVTGIELRPAGRRIIRYGMGFTTAMPDHPMIIPCGPASAGP